MARPNGHARPSRAAFLRGAAALSALALGGCKPMSTLMQNIGSIGGESSPLNSLLPEHQTIKSAGDALAIMLDELGGRFGTAFVAVGDEPEFDEVDGGIWIVTYTLAPESDPSKVFDATLHANAEDGKVLKPTSCDWPQYLFRDRLLGPFRESLSATAAGAGLAGWALTMTYARYDDRAWGEGDFEEYMGDGRDGDPLVRTFLIVPEHASDEACARAIYEAITPLYSLGRNLEVIDSREGISPLPLSLYTADIKYMFAHSRDSSPTLEEIERSITLSDSTASIYDGLANEPWDGSSTGGNPELNSHWPQVTWCPGYGPEA